METSTSDTDNKYDQLDKYDQLIIRACKWSDKNIRRLRRIWQIRTYFPNSLNDPAYDRCIAKHLAIILEKKTGFPGRLHHPESNLDSQWFKAVEEAETQPYLYCNQDEPFFTRLMMVLASRVRFIDAKKLPDYIPHKKFQISEP
jgi:hypothetical protein